MRVIGILKRTFTAIKMYYSNYKQFGMQAAFWIAWKYVFPSYRGKRRMDFLTKWFNERLEDLVIEYKQKLSNGNDVHMENMHISNNIPIWVCWLTGLDTRPELVRICNESVESNRPENAEVHYITLDNYKEYIDIPDYILKKYKQGKICPAHFSDVIRFCLLGKYGGMWLDATVYVTDTIPQKYLCSAFYTQKVEDKERYVKEPSRAQWCGFIWAGYSNNPLFCFIRDALFWYWSKYDSAIDYIFFDYIIKTAYNNITEIRDMIDSQDPNNEEIWLLRNLLEQSFDKKKYEELCKKNIFHKLSYQKQFLEKTADGEITFWGCIKKQTCGETESKYGKE